MRHGPHQGAQTSTRTGMVLRAIWRSNIVAATSSGCPAKTLALHLPHLASMAGRDGGNRLIVPHLLQTTRFSVMLLFQVTCHTSLHPARLTASHRTLFAPERWRSLWCAAFNHTGSRHPIGTHFEASKHLLHLSADCHSSRHLHDLGLRRSLPLDLHWICSCCDRESRRALRLNEDALYIGESFLNALLQRGDVVLHLG